MTDVQKIQLQRWWMEQLRALTRKVMAEEEKTKDKANRKADKLLGDYSSRDEIIEAYGLGNITEKQRDKYLDIWDNSCAYASPLYMEKLELLQDLYAEADGVLRDLEREG